MQVSDGTTTCLVHPSHVEMFLRQHRGNHLVAHNLAFDFHVLNNHLADRLWFRALTAEVTAGRFHDTMILDALIRLATNGTCHNRDLGKVSAEYLGSTLDKDSPYRKRFGEFLGMSSEEMETSREWMGFSAYATSDVRHLTELYSTMRDRAVGIMGLSGWKPKATRYNIRPDAMEKFGPLSEQLQIKASIVLYLLSRRPVRVCQERRTKLEVEYRQKINTHLLTMEERNPRLWKRWSPRARKGVPGTVKLTPKTGLPQVDQRELESSLVECGTRLGIEIPLTGKSGRPTTASDFWGRYADRDEFLAAYADLDHNVKRLELLAGLYGEKCYTRYTTLLRTGRTSASSWKTLPGSNFQQVPRDVVKGPDGVEYAPFRELFRADPGTVWLVADYSYLELRTLAAVCRARYGSSVMGDIICDHTAAMKRGDTNALDPHEWMGAASLGLTPAEFRDLPKSEAKAARQRAKVANFGLPGGLGVAKTVDYARGMGLNLTPAQAKTLKKQWFNAYPEMMDYLAEDTAGLLAVAIGTTPREVTKTFGRNLWSLTNLIRGTGEDDDGSKWAKFRSFCARGANWDTLEELVGDSPPELGSDRASALGKVMFTTDAVTLTGRVKAHAGYTDSRNLCFQGLAADGAKEALWRLYREGYDLVMFVHDEIIVSFPADSIPTPARARRAVRIMEEAMQDVIGEGIPVAVEGDLHTYWKKG
jgi:hypothetical protein